jgi:hypothetical protein
MKINTIEKGKKILKSIEAEHHADRNKIATGDLKTPTEMVKQDIDIILQGLDKMSINEAKKIKFSDHTCGFGTSLLLVKDKLVEKGISERHVVENQLFGMDIDKEKILITRLVLDPKRVYNVNKNITIGDSTSMAFETQGITHSWNNEPYLRGDAGKTPLFKDIIFNVDRQNPVQQSEGHLLPYSICLSALHRDLLHNFFKKGLEYIKCHGYKAFGNAIVNTNSYICNKGYSGPIKIIEKNRKIYEFDYKKIGYVIPGGTKNLTELLIKIRNESNKMTVKMQIFDKNLFRVQNTKFKDSIKFLESRSKTYDSSTIKFIDKKLASKFNDFYKWKVVWGYRPGGDPYTMYKPNFVTVIPPEVIINDIYVYQSFDLESQAKNRAKLFECKLINDWILKRSRTQLTFDAKNPNKDNQLSFMPNIDPKIKLKNDFELIDYFKNKFNLDKDTIKDLNQELILC